MDWTKTVYIKDKNILQCLQKEYDVRRVSALSNLHFPSIDVLLTVHSGNAPPNIIPWKNNHTERWKEMKNVSGVMLLTLGLNNVITVHNMPCLRLSCSQLVYVTSQWYESLSVFILWINWSAGTVMCVSCLYSLVLCLYWSHVKVLTSPTGGKH